MNMYSVYVPAQGVEQVADPNAMKACLKSDAYCNDFCWMYEAGRKEVTSFPKSPHDELAYPPVVLIKVN